MKHLIFLLLCFLNIAIQSCAINQKRKIVVNDSIEEGNLSLDKDSNGRIKFYDTSTNKLVGEENYSKGILHGPSIDYYLNGKIRAEGNFRDGKKHGTAKFFDSTGVLLSEQFYYYGIVTGPATDFKEGQPFEYYFSSLDNRPLFYLNYDSIIGKSIEKVRNGFIYFNVYKKADIYLHENERTEYLLYLINPPKFRFTYSLCIIKDNFQIVKEIQQFDNSKTWDSFEIDDNELKLNEKFAIRLMIDDDINQRSVEMFKKIN